jgi:UDP-glucose 4-epimerase
MEDQHDSPYSWSKSKNIELIHNYNKWYGLDFTIVYFSNVYGAGQISEGKYATVIGIFERQRKNNEILTVVNPGTQTRDFTHIDDTIDGIILASFNGKGDGYIIRTGKQHSIIDVARMFDSKYKFIDCQRGNRKESSGDYKKMSELGWKPQNTLKKYLLKIEI